MNTQTQLRLGFPQPIGPTLHDKGCNFAVYSPDAIQVFVCLFDAEETLVAEYPMIGKSGAIWHVDILGIEAGQYYGLRVDDGNGGYQKLLVDPYS